ncbi:uncharacterized protein LOC142165993 [Nicotiana tabacum]|uniref:Uncharacterized protein LOC142165993 n=1 Tax=Nicotiana tabacum TaxID=4097 RepID=A0AC58S6A3_TOBAC
MSVTDYFFKLRDFWDEFDALMPCHGCLCSESKKYAQHFEYHRLLQFLIGLNESYSKSRSQIMMIYPIPSINKAYSLLIDQESQRSLANFTQTNHTTEGIEGVVFYRSKNSTSTGGYFKFIKNQVQCEFCHYKGHIKENRYKLHGYPSDSKGKKKGQNSGVYTNNVSGLVFPNADETGNQQGSYGTQSGIQQVQHAYMPQFAQTTPNNSPAAPFFTKEQYQQILQMLAKENEEGPESSSKLAAAGTLITLISNFLKQNWIIDTGASNHMTSQLDALTSCQSIPSSEKCKVQLPTGNVVYVSHKGTSSDLYSGQVNGIGKEEHGLYILQGGLSQNSTATPINKYVHTTILTDSKCIVISGGHIGFPHIVVRACPSIVDKFSSRAISAAFLGYSSSQKGYVLKAFFFSSMCHLQKKPSHVSTPYYHPNPEGDITDNAVPGDTPLKADLDAATPSAVATLPDVVPIQRKTKPGAHPSKTPIGCRWIFKIKYKASEVVERYKARLVAKGYSQKEGLDYSETFSPVAKMVTVRSIVALAASQHWMIYQMDVHNAFLNGDLVEEVYHFVYVDDLIITWNNDKSLYDTSAKFQKKFKMKDLWELKFFLGIEFARSKERILMCQRKYALELISETGLGGAKPSGTPLELNQKFTSVKYDKCIQNFKQEGDQELKNPSCYQRLVGRLLYLTMTRPDIAFAVQVLSQYMHCPKVSHMEAALKVVRYIAPGLGLLMPAESIDKLIAYCDSNWGSFRVKEIKKKYVKAEYVHTKDQLPDLLTNSLEKFQHDQLLNKLGVKNVYKPSA